MANPTLNDLGLAPASAGSAPVIPDFSGEPKFIKPDPVGDMAVGEQRRNIKTLSRGKGPIDVPLPAVEPEQPTIQEATPEQVAASRDVDQGAEHPEDMASLGPLEQGLVATQAVMQRAEAKTVEGAGSLFAPVAAMARFISNRAGLPYPEVVDQIERDSEYWARSLSNKISYSDYMGVVAGNVLGAAPELVQFQMGPTWAMLRAASDSDRDLAGTILAGAERRAVGQVFHALGKVDAPGRVAGMAGVMTAQGMADEYGRTGKVTLENTATGLGTGLGMALTGGFGPGDKSGMRQKQSARSWVETSAQGDALFKEFDAGRIDKMTKDLAMDFYAADPKALGDTTIAVVDKVNLIRKGVDDWILREQGIDPATQNDGKQYKITGKTSSRKIGPDDYRTAIELYQGHDAQTLAEEWFHREYDRLPQKERAAVADTYSYYRGNLPAEAQPMSEAEFYAKSATSKLFSEHMGRELSPDRPAWLDTLKSTRKKFLGLLDTIRGVPGAQLDEAGAKAVKQWDVRNSFQAAYHGSPYRFDKFTLDHIGSGEGAQAYGWGLYFAGDKQVAEFYRHNLAGIGLPPRPESFTAEGVNYARRGKNEFLKGSGEVVTKEEYSAAFRKAQAEYEDNVKTKGQLYEVTIPDNDTMLDWDKPLSEQPQQVKKALESAAESGDPVATRVLRVKNDGWTGKNLYIGLQDVMSGLDQEAGRDTRGDMQRDKAASEYLKSIGIPGLRYLDGTSRGKGEGHHNYVVFDDAQIAIDKTYYQVRPTSDLIFDAMDPRGEAQKYSTGGNTNFTKLATTEQILDLIEHQSKINAENGEFARVTRGTRTHEQTIAAAQEPETIASVLALKPGEAGNAEQGLAARMLRNDAAAALVDSVERLSTEDFVKNYRAFTGLVLIEDALAAESGRAQEARNIVVGSAESQAISNALATLAAKTGDPKKLGQMIKGFRGEDGKVDVERLSKFARAVATRDSTTSEKLFEIFINSWLMMPSTHIANITGNTIAAAWSSPERALAGVVGAVRTRVGSALGRAQDGDRVYLGESIAHLHGMLEGFRDGFKVAAMAWKTGDFGEAQGKVESGHTRAWTAEALGFDSRNPIGKTLDFMFNHITRGPTRALAAEDEYFKTVGYRSEVRAQAWRQASAEGLEGKAFADRYSALVNNPPDNIRLAATDTAAYQTFTNKLGPMASGLMAARRLTTTIEVDGKPVDISYWPGFTASVVVPFLKTPVNITKYGLERTPLGFAMYGRDIAGGGARADLAIARVGMGAMLGGLVASLAAQGIITGGGPRDPAQRENMAMVGIQPYSVRIGDKYYSYQRFDPLSKIIGLSADFAQMQEWMNESEKENIAALIAASIANNVTDSTFMLSVRRFLDAASDPQRYGERWIEQGLAGFQPGAGLTRMARNIDDPYTREVEGIMDAFANQNPGFSTTLHPRLDRYGREIETGKFWLAVQGISPIKTSEKKNEANSETYPIDKVIRENHISIPRMDHTYHREGVFVRLTGDEYHKIGVMAGQESGLVGKLLDKVTSPQFSGLGNGPDGGKAKAIQNIFHQSRQGAKDALYLQSIGEPGGLAERIADAKTKAEEAKLTERPEDK